MVKLIGGGSVINGAYPVWFYYLTDTDQIVIIIMRCFVFDTGFTDSITQSVRVTQSEIGNRIFERMFTNSMCCMYNM